MLTEQEALAALKKVFPDCVPQKIITHENLYIILAPRPSDVLEGNFDPYFSVDINTGEARDYSIFQDGQARAITTLIKQAPEI